MTIEQILLQDIREATSLNQRAIAVATFYRYCEVREIDRAHDDQKTDA